MASGSLPLPWASRETIFNRPVNSSSSFQNNFSEGQSRLLLVVMLEAGTLPHRQGPRLVAYFQASCLFLSAAGCSAGKVSLSGATFLGQSTQTFAPGATFGWPHIQKHLLTLTYTPLDVCGFIRDTPFFTCGCPRTPLLMPC